MDSRRIGSVGELAVAARLAELGFTVSWPLIEASYDLIAEKDGHIRRIQVKTASLNKGGSYRCSMKHCRSGTKGYDKSDCDFLILYAPFSKDFEDIMRDGYFIIPVGDIKAKIIFATVFPAGKGKGNIKVCKWEKYKDGWDKI